MPVPKKTAQKATLARSTTANANRAHAENASLLPRGMGLKKGAAKQQHSDKASNGNAKT